MRGTAEEDDFIIAVDDGRKHIYRHADADANFFDFDADVLMEFDGYYDEIPDDHGEEKMEGACEERGVIYW